MRAAASSARSRARLCMQASVPPCRPLCQPVVPRTDIRTLWTRALQLCPHHHHHHPTPSNTPLRPHTPPTAPPTALPPRRHYASRPASTGSGGSAGTAAPPLSRLRNFGIIAHIDAGKTTTTERLLYYAQHTHTLGDVDTANTHTDFLPAERARGITIRAAAVTVGWREHALTLVDTPGHVDFTQEVESALRVMDCAVLLADAVRGVQAQTATVYGQAQRYGLPTLAYVNKMDREGADYERVRTALAERTAKPVLALQLPVYEREGEAGSFVGVVDLVEQCELRWDLDDDGRQHTTTPLKPAHPRHAAATRARDALCEAVAELDDAFMARYLEEGGEAVSAAELRAALRRLVLANAAIPLLCGASLRNKAVQPLMDAIVHYAPSPADVRGVRVTARAAGDQRVAGRRKKSGGRSRQRDEAGAAVVAEAEERVVQVREDGPLVALAFKVTHDLTRTPQPLVLVRVYTGTLTHGSQLINTTAAGRTATGGEAAHQGAVRERPLRLLSVDGEHTEEVASIPAGRIGALAGLRHTIAGDTLVRAGDEAVTLPPITSPPPVFFASIQAASTADADRLTQALACMVREDPSLSVSRSADTGQTLLQGQGALHLQVAHGALLDQWRVRAELGKVRVAYREGLAAGECGDETMYVWESGGGGGGDVVLGVRLEAGEVGSGVVVEVDADEAERMAAGEALAVMEAAVTAAAANPYAAASPPPVLPSPSSSSPHMTDEQAATLHAALEAALHRGPLLGLPLLDVRLALTRYYLTSATSASALRYAAHQLTRRVLQRLHGAGGVCVLEPVMGVVVAVDKGDVGGVLDDVTGRRRGLVLAVDSVQGGAGGAGGGGGREEVVCEVPLVELLDYADGLRSRTRGTGSYTMALKHYAPVPGQLQARILASQYA